MLLHKHSPETRLFIQRMNLGNTGRDQNTSIAIGIVVSSKIPLPSEPVVDKNLFYLETALPVIHTHLNAFSEHFNVHLDACEEYALSFYKARYTLLHDAAFYSKRTPSHLANIFNLGESLSPALLSQVETQGDVILKLCIEVEGYLQENKNGA